MENNKRMFIGRRLHWVFLVLGLLHAPVFAAAATAGLERFNAGIAAFEKREFQTALDYFKQAEVAGMHTSVLRYNLGVCYFKLHDYPQAKKYFELTAQDPTMLQLAHYNLGLTALRMGDETGARNWFELAMAATDNPKLAALAEYRLNKLEAQEETIGRQVFVGGSIAYGYDDNVNLVATDTPQYVGDQYLEALLYARLPIAGKLWFDGTAHLQDYRTVQEADFRQFDADLGYEGTWGAWRVMPEMGVSISNLGGHDYQTIYDFKITLRTDLANEAHLLLRYRYSDIKADNPLFGYLDGWRQQWRIEYKQPSAMGKLRLRYELETNDRQDLPSFNYSPTRHDFRLRLEQEGGSHWEFRQELQYRLSYYDEVAGISREDDRKILQLQALRIITGNMSLGIKYAYTDSTSNRAVYTYTRNDAQMFADFLF